jgi:hypothetical protein
MSAILIRSGGSQEQILFISRRLFLNSGYPHPSAPARRTPLDVYCDRELKSDYSLARPKFCTNNFISILSTFTKSITITFFSPKLPNRIQICRPVGFAAGQREVTIVRPGLAIPRGQMVHQGPCSNHSNHWMLVSTMGIAKGVSTGQFMSVLMSVVPK